MMILENSFFLWAMIGATAGAILGFSGAGGGIVSIPLLMTFGGYDIKKASTYALLVLTIGSGISWFFQRKNTFYPIAGVLIIFAVVAAYFVIPLKVMAPNWCITILLNLACVFSLYSLWILKKPANSEEEKSLSYRLKTASFGGIITGALGTMTGLGGGVVIVPWLTAVTRIRFDQAMACSLLAIFVISPISVWQQKSFDLTLSELLGLVISLVMVSMVVKKMTTTLPLLQLILIRKVVLSGAILLSMSRTLWALF